VAYCPKTCLENWSCKTSAHDPLTEVSYIVFNLTQAPGYIGYSASRNAIIVSFRGSQNIQNWIENLNFEKVPYIYCLRCEIHAGFYADYTAVAASVNNKVQTLLNKYPTARIVTTGHSLGGALATIAGMELKRVFYNV
jgi:predicted lipase